MKQLTIYCSRDLESRVVRTLDRVGVEGFLHVGEAAGNRFREPGALPRTSAWDASMIVVPGIAEEALEKAWAELEQYAAACEVRPCLHLVVASIERFL